MYTFIVRNSSKVNFDYVRYIKVCIVIYRRVLSNGLLYYGLVSRTMKENYTCVCDCDRKSNGTYFPELIHRNRSRDRQREYLFSFTISFRTRDVSYIRNVRNIRRTQRNSKWSLMTYLADGNDPSWGVIRASNFAY